MSYKYGKNQRVVGYFGDQDSPSVEVKIDLYNDGLLTPKERDFLVNFLTDETMKMLRGAPYLEAPLNKIKVKAGKRPKSY